jgi:hypothetical protein
MRPVPRPKHRLAVLIFAAVATAGGYLAVHDARMSPGQVHIATAAVKRANPTLYPFDPVYGSSGLWRASSPTLHGVLEMVLVPTRYEDLSLPFRAMGGLAIMVYLVGVYALLWRQTRSWSVSAFVAVLSTAVTYTLGDWYWGIGSLASITPETLCLVTVPLVLLAYLRYEDSWRVLLVFGFVGLLANTSFVTAMNIALVLWIVFVARHHHRSQGWPMAIGAAMAAAVCAAPYALYYASLVEPAPPGEGATAVTAYRAFRLAGMDVLYPDLLRSLLYWLLWGGILAVPAIGVLLRVERFRVRDIDLWGWFMAGGVFVSLGLQGVSQMIGAAAGSVPPHIDFIQASALVMLGLYVLFAQGLTHLFRIIRTYRRQMQWICVAVMVAWMLPSDNLRVARHAMYEAASFFKEPPDKPLRVQELRRDAQRRRELAEIAHWARARSSASAVFLTEEIRFRMLSRRSILASAEDIRFIYALAPGRLPEWRARVARQGELLHPPSGQADLDAIKQWIEAEIARRPILQGAGEWLVILDAGLLGPEPAPGEIRQPAWGNHLRLLRLR